MGTFTTFSNSLNSFFGDEAFEPAKLDGEYDGENRQPHHISNREVKYSDADKRLKYRITVGECLSWTSRRNGVQQLDLLDCKELIAIYKEKWKHNDGSQKPKAKHGAYVGELDTRAAQLKWMTGLIWVIGMDGVVYCNIPKIGRFQHSTFTAGDNVVSAGMWIVEQGRLLEMAPLSGHYKPNMRQFMKGVVHLKTAVKASKTSLLLYSRFDNAYKLVSYDTWSKMSFDDLNTKYTPHPSHSPMDGAPNDDLAESSKYLQTSSKYLQTSSKYLQTSSKYLQNNASAVEYMQVGLAKSDYESSNYLD